MQLLSDVPHVFDQGEVLELGALGKGGGAGGVEQKGDILWVHFRLYGVEFRISNAACARHHIAVVDQPRIPLIADANHVRNSGNPVARHVQFTQDIDIILAEEPVGHDDHFGIGVVEDIVQLVDLVPSVQRDRGAP